MAGQTRGEAAGMEDGFLAQAFEKAEELEADVRTHGIVRAFESVARRFHWEDARSRWVMLR